ncbi:hypothetical protein H4582DRAFT_1920729 [Lactarius indigo]|nr:hypothetical protein H4582DRAFT_1920729 [Lactarius indigo]
MDFISVISVLMILWATGSPFVSAYNFFESLMAKFYSCTQFSMARFSCHMSLAFSVLKVSHPTWRPTPPSILTLPFPHTRIHTHFLFAP